MVREHRRRLGITQEELGWRANLHRTYVADIERGARNPSLRSLASLAFALQVTVPALLADAPPALPSPPWRPTKGRIPDILLVEDNAEDAALTVRAFQRASVTNPVRTFLTAEDALEYLKGDGNSPPGALPSLILLDLNLPQLPGLEFLRRIKADPRTAKIPVIILSASRADRTILEAARLGAENYVVKPVSVEDFVQLIPKLGLSLTIGVS